jgi:hypothetical protein
MNNAQKALKMGKIVHAAFLLAALLYVWLPSTVLHIEPRDVPNVFVVALGFVMLTSVGLAVFFRSRDVGPASEKLRENPDDASAAAAWRRGVLLSLTFCISIVLLGLALRILGAAWNVAGVFYAVGILLMLVWTPRLDLPPR